ncbi:Helix-destabilizing protein [Mycobacterium basiliense]|uniref:Helix-destabilizing protein n=1 Tax=Mycobacterium basiliense TaxID=2094119 RepID=A0A3S4FSJ5_9MYCO|nr:single-stranded DNA-binding protein [Mycobacterium basiliense]VDM89809.1 Helix-destabilizing protein [Mycobacterium basiliense]
MFETPLTVVGHIVNDPQRRKVGDQEVIKFRVASNSRRRTGNGSWEPGNSLFITVNCWGRLVTGVGAALGKGAPVIAVGHVYTSEYEDRDGNRRSSLEMRARSVGPDLSRVFVRIERPGYTGPSPDNVPAASATQDPSAVGGDDGEPVAGAVDSVLDVTDEDAAGRAPMPLSA